MERASLRRPDLRETGGFTLFEVLAVVVLTATVLAIALNFYVNLSRASQRAVVHTHDIRRATSILDRVARDFESTVLFVKPPAVDPLDHPWVFLAEALYQDSGADHIKFVTRNHEPRSSGVHESDLTVVAYMVREGETGLELLRWSSPRLPESLDRSFPTDEEDGALLLADGLASFAVRFLDEQGEWSNSWDSSMLVESSELPLAVEIEVALAGAEASEEEEARVFSRNVLLPVRPLNLDELLNPLGRGLATVGDCIDFALAAQEAQGKPRLAQSVETFRSVSGKPFHNYSGVIPLGLRRFVRPQCLQ